MCVAITFSYSVPSFQLPPATSTRSWCGLHKLAVLSKPIDRCLCIAIAIELNMKSNFTFTIAIFSGKYMMGALFVTSVKH